MQRTAATGPFGVGVAVRDMRVRVIETKRLLLRPFDLCDALDLGTILGDPEVMRYSVQGVCDAARTRAFIECCISSYASHSEGPFALLDRTTHSLIGFCGLIPEQIGGRSEFNLGYRLGRYWWGQGLATEAVRAVLANHFAPQESRSAIVIVDPAHTASRRVAEKSGFTHFQDQVFHDRQVVVSRLHRQEWLDHQSAP